MGYRNVVNRFSTTRVGGWITRKTAAHVDPWIYRRTKGRMTFTGVPTIPQLVLTTTGRKSGKARSVQLGYLVDDGDFVVVASNFGQEHHPAWSYNLEADPAATVEVDGRRVDVTASAVGSEEKDRLWPRLDEVVPQFRVYRDRTDRDIRIFRLRSQDPA